MFTIEDEKAMSAKMLRWLESHIGSPSYKPLGCCHARGHNTIRGALKCDRKIAAIVSP